MGIHARRTGDVSALRTESAVVSGHAEGEGHTGAEGGATATDNGGGEAAGGGGKVTVNDTGVNVRSGPGTDSDTIGKAENGKEYELLGEENGWYKINFNGSTGYIRNDFATKN